MALSACESDCLSSHKVPPDGLSVGVERRSPVEFIVVVEFGFDYAQLDSSAHHVEDLGGKEWQAGLKPGRHFVGRFRHD